MNHQLEMTPFPGRLVLLAGLQKLSSTDDIPYLPIVSDQVDLEIVVKLVQLLLGPGFCRLSGHRLPRWLPRVRSLLPNTQAPRVRRVSVS